MEMRWRAKFLFLVRHFSRARCYASELARTSGGFGRARILSRNAKTDSRREQFHFRSPQRRRLALSRYFRNHDSSLVIHGTLGWKARVKFRSDILLGDRHVVGFAR